MDPFYLDADPRVRDLVRKGREFSEDDKQTLRAVELELLNRVIPEYRAAAARGQVELSTSPFFHPILPLLCDTDIYLRNFPDARLPRRRFAHPEDAAEQLARASAYHTRLFGAPPVGVWPSEGSVSDAIVPLVAAAGFRWMGTDELILAKTLGITFTRDDRGRVEQPERLYAPYRVRVGGASVACAFRDHVLSDLIGFTYSGGRRNRPPTTSSGTSSMPAVLTRSAPAGERPSSRSSWMARTRGSISTTAGGPSSARSISGCRGTPSFARSRWLKPAKRRDSSSPASSPAPGSRPTSPSGSAMPTTAGRGASWRMPVTRWTPVATRGLWRRRAKRC